MKLADRSFMNQTRYSQSFGDFGTRKNKLLSTGFTNNSMNTTMRLPKLSRSLSSTSSKSAKQRVEKIIETLDKLKSNIDDLRMQTRQSRRCVNFLKDDLADRELTQHKNNLSLQVKKLENAFKFYRKQDQDRTAALRHDCRELSNGSQAIIDLVSSLNNRVDRLEEGMGIYSGKEKHKF